MSVFPAKLLVRRPTHFGPEISRQYQPALLSEASVEGDADPELESARQASCRFCWNLMFSKSSAREDL
jgi:hypothetical protein